jgi:hypothetical protein
MVLKLYRKKLTNHSENHQFGHARLTSCLLGLGMPAGRLKIHNHHALGEPTIVANQE